MSKSLTRKLQPCEVCNVLVRSDNMDKHLRNVHPAYHPTSGLQERAAVSVQKHPSASSSKAAQQQKPASLYAPRRPSRYVRSKLAMEIDGSVTVDESNIVLEIKKSSEASLDQQNQATQSAPKPVTAHRDAIQPEANCPICMQAFGALFLINHYRYQHGVEVVKNSYAPKGKKNRFSMMKCLVCGKELKSTEVINHRKTCSFSDTTTPSVRSASTTSRRSTAAANPGPQHPRKTSLGKQENAPGLGTERPVHSPPGFEDHEPDGGKYMGWNRREGGKFGSMPLYDDYSDEADA